MASTIAVVIPNYNGRKYLGDCLRAIRGQTRKPDRIIVVDNGSSDGSVAYLRREFPETERIALPENTGFCGAVNTGIRSASDMDYVFLLNNDTKAEPGCIAGLMDAMERDPRLFSAQAKMLRMDDPSRIDDAGDLYCALGWAFARGKGRPENRYEKPCRIFAACAGAAVYRTAYLKKVGLFDEHHFAYLEDTDIGWRARLSGYRNEFVPSARVLHVGSASSGSIYNLFKVKNSSRNSIYLIAKNMPPLQILINLPFLIPGFAAKAVFFARRGYGREYIRGLAGGFFLARKGAAEGRRVRFRPDRLPVYLAIQLELWVNIVRRFTGR